MKRLARFSILLLILFSITGIHSSWASTRDRYFLMGSGELDLLNHRNNRQATVQLLDKNGAIREEALNTVDFIFGFPTEKKQEHISPRMLFMLSYFSDKVAPGKTIQITSAYRSPEYNEKIRQNGANAAKTSTHIDGIALDFWIEGVEGKQLWETVRAMDCCGVGHYGGRTIHLDAGRPRFWEAATSGTGKKGPDYNRHLYASTLYDRYVPGEEVRISLSGISVFDFGIVTTLKLYNSADHNSPVAYLPLKTDNPDTCHKIDTRKATRFLQTTLPQTAAPGKYVIELEFCEKPFEEMIDKKFSTEIEIMP